MKTENDLNISIEPEVVEVENTEGTYHVEFKEKGYEHIKYMDVKAKSEAEAKNKIKDSFSVEKITKVSKIK